MPNTVLVCFIDDSIRHVVYVYTWLNDSKRMLPGSNVRCH